MKTKIKKTAALITRTIKSGLAMVLPILFIGSMTVMLNSFPFQPYQNFLDTFLGGALRNIIQTVQGTTVGILAIYLTISISLSYMNQTEEGTRPVYRFGSILSCLTGFTIILGIIWDRDISLLSGQGVFSSVLAGVVGSVLFRKFEAYFRSRKMAFVDGADSEFNAALHIILPFLCVTLCFAAANYIITVCFDVPSIQHLFMKGVDAIFLKMQRSYASGLLFTSLTSIMWWFGIHGNNVLDQVAVDMFTEIIPDQVVSKAFIDTFVNMGGTGCTIGLLLAMIIFGKRNSTKKLSGMAFLPALVNISELLVFGFPVIYNPAMAIPFLLSPILCYSGAFLMTRIGFLPMVETTVEWTTPALISGYL
ncbi:MAG: PTS transporter subunit EIIC, partial [Lachnospiraceae bacterium]|nr:PTS transporter subunit EIIC [Lachnospiraceae bacterium]